ncbi:MAG: AAA family ATPase [Erysipelotrichaceae bacterium]|nr:AAA family ATPase [Erysipelotrichaceae bacterium]
MYLKTIKASGFKSFANKIQIDLENKITGIVGPNGSGKSNIVDAVRWVLGEQSVKSLRGDGSMTDVIFSGSKSREPLNVASVTLVFDNTDHVFPLDFNEVSIKRRVYHDGTNEYFINGEKCRLKDINDLLLDSGIAKESFNIISQGRVEEILSAKAGDRRIIFEEAANVLKYKRRKEDALRKLDKTNENMNRINDIIAELESQVEPLKEQASKAEEYNNAKEELGSIEISLVTHDITEYNKEYELKSAKIETLNNELINLKTKTSSSDATSERQKLELSKLNSEINDYQEKLLEMTKKVEQANSHKQIVLERKKYELNNDTIHKNIVSLKEEQLKIQNQVSAIEFNIDENNTKLEKIDLNIKNNETFLDKLKTEKRNIDDIINKNYYNLNIVKNRINSLETSIENNGSLPLAVRNILNNPRLKGIHDIVGNIIDVDPTYLTAITTSLGAAFNNIIVDNASSAEEAIKYLKENKFGRVTFLPINVMKPKYVDEKILNILKHQEGFINIASNLVRTESLYQTIISNQLGNTLIVDNIKNANIISKQINFQYKIVSLSGEIVHVGGAITGGETSKIRSAKTDKQELLEQTKEKEKLELTIKNCEEKINEIDNKFHEIDDKNYLLNKEKLELKEKINISKQNIEDLYKRLNEISSEITSSNNILKNDLSKEETEAINEFYRLEKGKEELSQNYKKLLNKREDLTEEISLNENLNKKDNEQLRNTMNELKDLEILVNRLEVKIDSSLKILSENYGMTYEFALEKSIIDLDIEFARTKVNKLRKIIKDLGEVNLGAIAEYKRVSERYEFLLKQRDDLLNATNTLLEIVKEMDVQMEKDFKETFKVVKENFKEIFKQLFKGGTADLIYTDPKNVLETGVEIVASPPGKKLTSLSLLSGGEKTLTAISLLFAILKTKKTSFCILDEVEAALDEANVASFGEYVTSLKDKTQFIIITHKKKTMEYADTLYGITMQESGVSKLVSVKLNDIEEKTLESKN